MKDFLENYTLIKLVDDYDWKLDGVIAINNKHDLGDFKKEWQKARNMLYKARENDDYDDDDITFITEHISNKFDWAILNITNFEIYY